LGDLGVRSNPISSCLLAGRLQAPIAIVIQKGAGQLKFWGLKYPRNISVCFPAFDYFYTIESNMQMFNELHGQIREYSAELGFSDCGIVPARFLAEEEEHLLSWLGKGYNGRMEYLARNADKRLDPAKMAESAQSVIIVSLSYNTRLKQTDPDAPMISRYASGKDYHVVVKSKLHHLMNYIREIIPESTGRIFTDTAPILEKAWARCAGLGWIGRNNLLISPQYGSFCFLGGIVLDRPLPDADVIPQPDRCGNCSLCMDACPTRALVAPRILDARRCISYQTVELSDSPDQSLSGKFRNRVFGCDICQEVCPWNHSAPETAEKDFVPLPALLDMTSSQWDQLDIRHFHDLFRDTPVIRAGFDKLKKNIKFIRNPEN
jgi:epoxyqueuosine reductase